MTQEEKNTIIGEVLSSIRTNSKTIADLTPVTSLSDSDSFEVGGGKRVTYKTLSDLISSMSTEELDLFRASLNRLKTEQDAQGELLKNTDSAVSGAQSTADEALYKAQALENKLGKSKGIATLDAAGHIETDQLGRYVIEFNEVMEEAPAKYETNVPGEGVTGLVAYCKETERFLLHVAGNAGNGELGTPDKYYVLWDGCERYGSPKGDGIQPRNGYTYSTPVVFFYGRADHLVETGHRLGNGSNESFPGNRGKAVEDSVQELQTASTELSGRIDVVEDRFYKEYEKSRSVSQAYDNIRFLASETGLKPGVRCRLDVLKSSIMFTEVYLKMTDGTIRNLCAFFLREKSIEFTVNAGEQPEYLEVATRIYNGSSWNILKATLRVISEETQVTGDELTPERLLDMAEGRIIECGTVNLFNESDILPGLYSVHTAEGVARYGENEIYNATDYIEVVPGAKYGFVAYDADYRPLANGLRFIDYYDKDMGYIGREQNLTEVTVPVDARYCRLTVYSQHYTVPNRHWMFSRVEDIDAAKTYVPYGEEVKLKPSLLSEGIITEPMLSDGVQAKLSENLKAAKGMTANGDMAYDDVLVLPGNSVKSQKVLSFSGRIESWPLGETLTLAHGGDEYGASRVEITKVASGEDGKIRVRVFLYSSFASQVHESEHDFVLKNNIEVQIVQDCELEADIRICSNGVQKEVRTRWWGCHGDISAKVSTMVLRGCTLGWFSTALGYDNWLFGDSYFDLTSAQRWTSYLIKNGQKGNLLNAYPGEGSLKGLEDLKNLLEIGRPKRVVWCMGMNDRDYAKGVNANWELCFNEARDLCERRGIEFIGCTLPNVIGGVSDDDVSGNNGLLRKHDFKNAIVRESGLRYIDFERAVSSSAEEGLWYGTTVEDIRQQAGNGMLSADGVHPTQKGALALYMQAMADVPELGRYGEGDTLSSEERTKIGSIGNLTTKVSNLETTVSGIGTQLGSVSTSLENGLEELTQSITAHSSTLADQNRQFSAIQESLFNTQEQLGDLQIAITDSEDIAIVDRQGVQALAVTDSAKRRLFIDQWNKAAGSAGGYNEDSGFFELNGITDITYEEALEIWEWYPACSSRTLDCTSKFSGAKCRTLFPVKLGVSSSLAATTERMFDGCPNLEVLRFESGGFVKGTCYFMFLQLRNLKSIEGIIHVPGVTYFQGTFQMTDSVLEEIYLSQLSCGISLAGQRKLKFECLEFMVTKATNTKAITITVHPDIYAKLTGDTSKTAYTSLTAEEKEQWTGLVATAQSKNIAFATT